MSLALRLLPALAGALAPVPASLPAYGHRSDFGRADPVEGYGHLSSFDRDVHRGGPPALVGRHAARALVRRAITGHRSDFAPALDRHSVTWEAL